MGSACRDAANISSVVRTSVVLCTRVHDQDPTIFAWTSDFHGRLVGQEEQFPPGLPCITKQFPRISRQRIFSLAVDRHFEIESGLAERRKPNTAAQKKFQGRQEETGDADEAEEAIERVDDDGISSSLVVWTFWLFFAGGSTVACVEQTWPLLKKKERSHIEGHG